MKYLDSNVLIRIITGDNKALVVKAIAQIQAGGQHEFRILDAILVETCFVLEFHDYKMKRSDIADALTSLLAVPQIFVTDETQRSLELYRKHPKLDYADCLLITIGGKAGVLTFDKDVL